MQRVMDSLAGRRLCVFLHVLIALAVVPGILQLKTDNSPQVFFPRDAHGLEVFDSFRSHFAGGRGLRVAIGGAGLWSGTGLEWLDKLEQKAASLEGTAAALGPAGLHRWLLLDWPPTHAAGTGKRLLQNSEGLLKGLVSPDGNTISLLLVLEEMPAAEVRKLLRKVQALLKSAPPGITAQLSGLPVLERAMDDEMLRMATVILPLLLPLAMLFLWLTFGRVQDVLAPMLYVGLCLTMVFGIMGYAGVRLNLISFVITPLLFVIALATAIHILVFFRKMKNKDLHRPLVEVMVETRRLKGLPVLWTGLTTLAAFGSLMTSPVPPLRAVGLWSALGIIWMTVSVFTFYLPLLSFQKGNIRREGTEGQRRTGNVKENEQERVYGRQVTYERRTGQWGKKLAGWAIKRRKMVLAVTAITLGTAIWGMMNLSIEDNIGRYFSSGHPVSRELDRLQTQGIGVFSAELILHSRGKEGFQNPDAMQHLAALTEKLRQHDLIYGAISSGDLIEGVLRSMKTKGPVSTNSRWMALGLMQSIPESRKLLYTMLTPDGSQARVTLLLPVLSFDKSNKVFEAAQETAKKVFPDAGIDITGQYVLLMSAQRKLMKGLIWAFSLTLCCIVTVFLLILRRIGLTLRVLIPNVWPVAVILGGMGWLGIPLDSATVMTASVVLGLAVDDTFHTLGHYMRLTGKTSEREAIEMTLERTAPAHILTTVTLAAGFAVCTAGELLPIVRMGGLSAAAIGLALAGDLVLIPAILAGRQRRKGL